MTSNLYENYTIVFHMLHFFFCNLKCLYVLFTFLCLYVYNYSYKSASTINILQAFRKLDRQNKGYIDADYLKRVMKENGNLTVLFHM